LIAFVLLTGARDRAIASMKLKHVDVVAGRVFQDARELRTKFSKTYTTYFFPVGDEIRQIVADWVRFLREEKLWSHDDPLFPATNVVLDKTNHFTVAGLKREHWSTATPIRKIFAEAFTNAGLPYFNPHSFRNTLVCFGETVCQTPEEFKAWSQNLGHEGVLTTFRSYGEVSTRRQREIIEHLSSPQRSIPTDPKEFAKAVAQELRKSKTEV
jgi:integrase